MPRIIRSKRKYENLIRTVWQDTNKGKFIRSAKQAVVIAAIALTLSHFEEEDRLHNTIHAAIFAKIYLTNDPISLKDFSSKRLLSEAAIEMRLDNAGYSILSAAIKERLSTDKQKPGMKKTKANFAREVGVGVRTLKDNTDIYMRCFAGMLDSVNP